MDVLWTKLKRFGLYLYARHWANLKWIETLFAFASLVAGGFAVTSLARDLSKAWPGNRELTVYLYVSYFVTTIGIAGLLLVVRQLWHHLGDTREQRDKALEIEHRMAEVVRRYAYDLKHGTAFKKLQDDVELHEVLEKVRDYMRLTLGRTDIHIAVKHVSGESESRRLDAILRHPRDTPRRKSVFEAADSVVWKLFSEGTRERQRVIVENVQALDQTSDQHVRYTSYALHCGFRSVLAFPLREPKSEKGETTTSGVVGFVSFDCPDPYGFDGLFEKGLFAQKSNDGSHLKDTPDIQFFFGVADSLATLVVMGAR